MAALFLLALVPVPASGSVVSLNPIKDNTLFENATGDLQQWRRLLVHRGQYQQHEHAEEAPGAHPVRSVGHSGHRHDHRCHAHDDE